MHMQYEDQVGVEADAGLPLASRQVAVSSDMRANVAEFVPGNPFIPAAGGPEVDVVPGCVDVRGPPWSHGEWAVSGRKRCS